MSDPQRWSREASVADVPLIRAFIDTACQRLGCSEEVTSRLTLAAVEICTNAIRHGYGGGPGWLDVCVHASGGAVTLTVTDHAARFDPTSAPAPTFGDDRDPGGLGLHLVTELTDRASYRDLGHGNEHTITIDDRWAP